MRAHAFDTSYLKTLSTQISHITGLKINPRLIHQLEKAIEQRMHELHLEEPFLYFQKVLGTSIEAESELTTIQTLILNTETRFFRDKGQFKLLKEQILPEIIRKRQVTHTLKVWCAGCSTGQEVLSLAMLIHQLIPNWSSWNILILGTDINEPALEVAAKGCYPLSIAQQLDPQLLERYFTQQEGKWCVKPSLLNHITYKQLNLVHDHFPNPKQLISNIDLILCRNVFIYFHKDAIESVVHKFTQTLCHDGFLITGHGELLGISHALKLELRPYSAVFKKVGDSQT